MQRSTFTVRWASAGLTCVAALLAAGAAQALPNANYADDCARCHGDFVSADDYTSLTPGQGTWDGDLHDVHQEVTASCTDCHSSNGDNPGFSSSANGGPGCAGCHNPGGLAAHHVLAETVTDCNNCHDDADGGLESDLPPYYGTDVTSLTDPCDDDFAGGPLGLDNDGDLLADGEDPDCDGAAAGAGGGAGAAGQAGMGEAAGTAGTAGTAAEIGGAAGSAGQPVAAAGMAGQEAAAGTAGINAGGAGTAGEMGTAGTLATGGSTGEAGNTGEGGTTSGTAGEAGLAGGLVGDDDDDDDDDDGCGCRTAGGTSTGSWPLASLAALGLLFVRRRRNS